MSPAQKSVTSKIARTSLVVALLLGTPIPIVWFGAKEAEKRIAAGDLDGAERMLSAFGALSTYPLLPRLAEARVHGVRCELSARKGLDSDAMDHFVKELSILTGHDLTTEATDGEEGPGPAASLLRFRKGVEDWSRGYAAWIESAPESMPDLDRDFLVPVLETETDADPDSVSGDPAFVESLRELFNRATRGEADDEIAPFLGRHSHELEEARRWSDEPGPGGEGIAGVGEASDLFRILYLEFLRSCQNHQEPEALASFARCGRILRRIEAEPSLVALLVIFTLRSQWTGSTDELVERMPLSISFRQGLARELTRYRSDPEFPPLAFRYEYASSRKIYVDSYLEGNWETASPAGRRLFVRQCELAFARHEALAAAVSAGADPKVSEMTLSALHEAGNLSPKILELRLRISRVFYGSKALTEADGGDFAKATDEWVVFLNDSIAMTRLGRLDETLRELYEEEARLIRKLESEP